MNNELIFIDKTAKETRRLIECNLFPAIAKLPISSITAYKAIETLKPLQQKGTLKTLKYSIQNPNDIMFFAIYRISLNISYIKSEKLTE
ncbi:MULTISPECIES: phage integrase central domain-containing protein [unclassified Gilliamella]|uniref:phage integrase central domain-containing protein n=1 Tax=unclassified Gilliamella TaxID=2685620 RepID=UPI003A5CB800